MDTTNKQKSNTTSFSLIERLERGLAIGSVKTIRDVATLLDKPNLANEARQLLEKYTFFTPAEINITTCSREELLSFYYDHYSQIQYTHELQAYYMTALEEQKIALPTQNITQNRVYEQHSEFRRLISTWEKNQQANSDLATTRSIIAAMRSLDYTEGYAWLRNLLTYQAFGRQHNALYAEVALALSNNPTENTLNSLLDAIDKGLLLPEEAKKPLLTISNGISIPQECRKALDSLGSLAAVRSMGYEKMLPFKEIFFYEKVDYLGKILLLQDNALPTYLQHNALKDLIASEHPRSLFYLATYIRLNPTEKKYATQLLQQLTRLEVGNEQTSDKALMIFWANKSTDYTWEKMSQSFAPKAEMQTRIEQYEKQFRQLNSENYEVALQAYTELTKGNPYDISVLTDKFRPLLRTYNRKLPDIKFGYLEQLTQLNYFCQQNGINTNLSPTIDSSIVALTKVYDPFSRYKIENSIINQLSLSQASALEYYACLHANSRDLSFSIGRILDYFYTQHWSEIVQDDEQLRLYLKKAYLFRKIGATGICGWYQHKINLNDRRLAIRLSRLAKEEADNDILDQIKLVQQDYARQDTLVLFRMLLNNPANFTAADLRQIPAPKEGEYELIINKIQNTSDKEALKTLFNYMDLHAAHNGIKAVPQLYRIIGDLRVVERNDGKTVGDRVVELLEVTYHHHINADDTKAAWREMWASDSKNYKKWNEKFFIKQLNYISTAPNITIYEVNELTTSSLYDREKYGTIIVQALPKVQPTSDIRRLQMPEKLRSSTDLAAFRRIKWEAKDLDDFLKLFEPDDSIAIWGYIHEQTKNYNLEDLGSFYNAMFRVNWFDNAIHDGRITMEKRDSLLYILEDYLRHSEAITEFEEQACWKNIAELTNIGKSTIEKLEATLVLDITNDSKVGIQDAILARVSYKDISQLVPYFNRLCRKQGMCIPTSFLFKDLGLPIFDPDENEQAEIIRLHATLSELEFYKFYLLKFGVDFVNEKGELDFSKIATILRYEIVSPFTGGGSQRDYFTYGIIKVLELYFGERLGFHEKLNENQTFYSYSSTKRAAAWHRFLVDKKLVNPDTTQPSSFNKLYQ